MKHFEVSQSADVTVEGLRASGRAVITRSEAASVLDVDPRTVTRMINDGEIFAIRTKGTVRIPLERFLSLFDPTEVMVDQGSNIQGARALAAVT